MNRLTIKTKLTVWYTFFTTAIMVILLSFILGIMYNLSVSSTHTKLKNSTEFSFDQIDYENKVLHIDDDILPYNNGIYTSVYNVNGHLLYGYFPPFFHQRVDIKNKQVQRLKADNKVWYIYDEIRNIEGREDITVRTLSEQSESEKMITYLIYFSIIALPIVVLLAALIGYMLTKKSFKPIQTIQQTAADIEQSKDLSRRINLGEGKDEIHQLSKTFDNMFDRLQESFENEKQFTSDASHELRTPTTAIMAQCEYALDYVDDIDEAKEVFETIFDESKKMSNLLSYLLLMARADKNTQNINFEHLDISILITKLILLLQPEAEKKNIAIQEEIYPSLFIQADESLMTRLFSNLISNAISYGKENGHILITVEQEDKMAVIKIKDDGIGISKENISKIWKRFYQVNPARSSIENGSSGLGLSIVKWIVEAHNGTIEVQSELDKGTTFIVFLPIW